MTELRSKPGKILDRVENNGEAFIIERNNKRSACLVPISIFLPDISPSRIALEISELEKHDIKQRVNITEKRELAFCFSLELDDGKQVDITIVLPHRYPNNCPRVYASSIRDDSPHQWRDGALCLYGVLSEWNPGKHTLRSTLILVERWLGNYEIWDKTGTWPKLGETPNE